MLVEHTLQYPTIQPEGGAVVGLAMVAARAPLLLLVGMALSTEVNGVILQSFSLFFLVGVCVVGLPRRALAALAGACLIGGPLLVTLLRRSGEIGSSALARTSASRPSSSRPLSCGP